MKLFKRLGLGMLLAVILFGFSGRSAEAADFVAEDQYTLSAGETVDDTLFVSGARIVIDGDINGDLFAAGESVTINGTVNGNVFAAAGNLTVNGTITEDLFGGAGELVVTGDVKDIRVAGASISLKGAEVFGDLMAAGGVINLDGKIEGDAFVGTESLNIGERGKIDGKLSYTTPERNERAESIASSAEYFEDNFSGEDVVPSTGSFIWKWIRSTIFAVIGYVLLAWLLIRFVPGFLARNDETLNNQFGNSIGWGLVGLVFLPIVVFIVAILIGIFFGFGSALATGLAGMTLLALVGLFSPVVIAHWLGVQFTDMGMSGVLVAVAVVAVLIQLPLVGSIFALVSYVLVLGSIFTIIKSDSDDADNVVEKAPAAA